MAEEQRHRSQRWYPPELRDDGMLYDGRRELVQVVVVGVAAYAALILLRACGGPGTRQVGRPGRGTGERAMHRRLPARRHWAEYPEW